MKSLCLGILLLSASVAQSQPLIMPPNGGNKKAMVGERIGITDVTIHYDRPHVKGREGKIWGQLVPAGFTDQGFGNTKEAPWRAGANESTTIEFSTDVSIEGQPLAAGKYGFFVAYAPDACTLIFSQDNSSWGSFYYDPSKDVLRVKVKPVANNESTEWLAYEFSNETDNSAVVNLKWEKLVIPFTVQVDLVKTQLASFRKELRTEKGFIWQPWQTAAQWCVDHNTNLEEALAWADTSINPQVLGDRNFATLSTKAAVLDKLNRNAEANAIMKEALPMGNMGQVHQYARQLLVQKKNKEALEVFRMNYEKNPDQFMTTWGLVRGYSASGDFSKALEYAGKALPLAPPGANKSMVENGIESLKKGKDINN
ncbi:Protein of unknown function [Hydrobacter penzbergensis]|uniref:DUF2911 domain-containing protein n=1 Tax=Hydrobacter penzbergensis TaxID=1235997 RepID=A0A8X8IDE9_9BACT|nr:DUF2911 domain-containing protein [Hydrobacter penzbergensis]SDW49361.1 Protein of unknown function [Hydrobacter penzbergensis]